MGTVADEVIRRINGLETSLEELQNQMREGVAGASDSGLPIPPSSSNRATMDQLAEIRRRLEGLEANPFGPARTSNMGPGRNFMSP